MTAAQNRVICSHPAAGVMTMYDAYLYEMAKFKQEQLEKAAVENCRAREARSAGQAQTIQLKRGLSLRRLFAWLG